MTYKEFDDKLDKLHNYKTSTLYKNNLINLLQLESQADLRVLKKFAN